MQHQPLSDVRNTMNVQWYRSAMSPARFRELSKRNDTKAWMQAGGHLALFVLTGLCVFASFVQGWWLALIIAVFLHGTVASFFKGTAVHELGHGTVFHSNRLNNAFLYTFSTLSWWNPFDYALSHTYHHRYTLHPEGDRENLLPLHPNTSKTFLLQLFTMDLKTDPGRTFSKGGFLSTLKMTALGTIGRVPVGDAPSYEWLKALHADQPQEHQKSIWWSRWLLAFHASVLLIAVATGLWVLPLIFSTACYTANWLSYFVALPQHCGLRDNVADFRKCTRSIRLPAIAEFLYWRMNWHTEHHMYAGIPCYNLPALAQEIKDDMPEPRTLAGAWREMLDTWERQKTDPAYQFDTPLPPTAKTTRARKSDKDEASIGDLAPKGLA